MSTITLISIGLVLCLICVIILVIRLIFSKKTDNSDIIRQKEDAIVRLEEKSFNLQKQIEELQNKLSEKDQELKDWRIKNTELSNEQVRAKQNEGFIRERLVEKNALLEDLNKKIDSLNLELQSQGRELTSTKGEKQILSEKLDNALLTSTKQRQEYEKLQETHRILNTEYTQAIASLQAEKEKNLNLENHFKEYKENLENIGKQNEERLQNLTNKILEEKTKKFSESNAKEINDIVLPLKEQINEFKKKVEDGNVEQAKLHTELKTQIENIITQTNTISQDAINLTNALKNENKIMGNWGENVLETILQNSGLQSGIHYQAQYRIKDEENKTYIPDFIINLPSGEGEDSKIIIDSKVSLLAYERYFNAKDEEEKEVLLQKHLESIKNHINELAEKNYDNIAKGSVGFVMMFIPVEPAYLLAMQSDTTLWEYAYKRKIVLISATNMIASLRLIAELWKINTRNEEAENMAETCRKIYEKLVGFLENFEKVGNAIQSVSTKFEEAKKQLRTGNGNAMKQLEALKEKGINSTKKIPESLKGEEY
ncbi:MAG: DNA recombination protein RmuC [Bacteroidota bacterium]|nr:DNA recombination protein RmuC [Bacteroidota bacterium]